MRPENESVEALDLLIDELQQRSVAGASRDAQIDPEIARVLQELRLLATDTPIRPGFEAELRRRLADQADARVTPRALASQEAQRRELLAALRTPIVTTSMAGQVTGF